MAIIQRLLRKGFDLARMSESNGYMHNMQDIESTIQDIMHHEGYATDMFVAPGVPRIRPILIYLSTELGQHISNEQVESVGLRHLVLSTEVFYTAIIAHDLALGKSGGRRRKLLKKILGTAVRIHDNWQIGSQLLLRSLELMTMTQSAEIMKEFVHTIGVVQRAQKESAGATLTMYSPTKSTKHPPTSAEILSFAENYTGEMFSFACRAGGLLAKTPNREVNLLARYGRELGVAWHLTEELAYLDCSDSQALPSLERQILINRPFYTVALAIESSPQVAEYWMELQKKENPALLLALLREIQGLPVIAQTRQKIVERVWSAQSILRKLPQSAQREQLENLTQMLAK